MLSSGCGVYLTTSSVPVFSKRYQSIPLKGFKYVYIDDSQRDYGLANNADLKAAFAKFGEYEVLDEIPTADKIKKQTLVVKYEYTNSRFWDVAIDPQSSVNLDASNFYVSLALTANNTSENSDIYPSILNNAVLDVLFYVFDLDSGALLIENPIQITYQQVYQGDAELKTRPDAIKEFNRMSKLAFDRFLVDINPKNTAEYVYFESGYKEKLFSWLFGNTRNHPDIVRGIRFAHGQNWKNAILTWILVTYEPVNFDKYFFLNRAAAFYNIGQAYSYFEQWDKAALMFAYANQSAKTTHYAQAWADAVSKWRIQILPRLGGGDLLPHPKDISQQVDFISATPSLKSSVLWPDEDFYRDSME